MIQEALLKEFGKSGMPTVVDDSLKDTWDAYANNLGEQQPEARIISVLGFLHLIIQSGMKRMLTWKQSPSETYKQMRSEEFDVLTAELVRLIAKYRLFDVLRAFKTKFTIVYPIRGDLRSFQFDVCLEPKKKEHMDACLAKLSGMLYSGDVPKQLQEVWKKRPTSSNAKPSSALPKYAQALMGTSLLGYLPLLTKPSYSVFMKRLAGDVLLMRIVVKATCTPVAWLPIRKHETLLKTLLAKSFTKLKG